MAIADLGTDADEVAFSTGWLGLCEHRSKRDGTIIVPRTVRNVASAVRASARELRTVLARMVHHAYSTWRGRAGGGRDDDGR